MAGTKARTSMSAKRRASGSVGNPRTTLEIFARYSHMMARIDPN